MSYSIKPGSTFGRIGTSIGKGLAEQIPKEVDRVRLSQGLKNLATNSSNYTPEEYLANAFSIPGLTPQMAQSLGELARQRAKGNALNQFQSRQNEPKAPPPSPFPQKPQQQANGSQIPSITKEKPLEQIQEGYIPKTQDQIFESAGEMYNQNPALFNYDPNLAIEAAEKDDIRNQAINQAYEKQHQRLSDIQDNVVKRLKDHSTRLGADAVPADLYSSIEDKAIQATKSKKDGGEGLTEQQAMKKYGAELDSAARDYAKINEIGNWGITGRTAKETLRSLKGLQESFENRNDTRNFAETLQSENKLSPKVAYSIAEPVSRVPELNSYMKSLPNLESVETIAESKVPPSVSIPKTLQVAPKLAEYLSKNEKASPLAIAYELEKKGYDPETWLQYVTDNRSKLNLKENQGRQVDTPNNLISTWNDWWLSSWSGLE